ncbi:SusC/RagA family TonB-linked outer membrane protein [Pedobacter sp. GSP4]|uniref:SusC/RagA family TonB-linked outer membrane protein n=1 Tax=Pedobacter sp. GSP4 TaxID=3453716 RepID=UPI003EE9CE48
MKRKLLLLAMFLGLQYAAIAQNKKASGKVIDAVTKQALSGVNIAVPSIKLATSTNADGLFSFDVPADTKAIFLSYVGYQDQVVQLTGQPMQIGLMADSKELNTVVVVGYGTQKKKDLTGSITSISAKDVGGRQTLQISEALQGSVPGLSSTRTSGAPGSSSTILIRGITTIGTNSPLVIVDGVPGNIDNVNPNDVENITVLKDAASAAIYGSRGAAGVILVTTKRGLTGQSNFEYNYEYGAQKATALPKYVGVVDYMKYINEQVTNDGGSSGPYPQATIDNYLANNALDPDKYPNTDWQNAILSNSTAPRQRHGLVFTTGTDKIKSKASFDYSEAGAFYDNRNFNRYLFRINNDFKVSEKFNANLDVNFSRTTNNGNGNELSGYNPIYESRVMPPIYDDVYNNGDLAFGKDGRNPVAQIKKGGFQQNRANQLGARMALNYKPIKGFTLTALVAPTFDFNKGKNFSKQIKFNNPDGTVSTVVNQARTILTEGRTENFTINGQLLANYTKTIANNHNLDVLVGYEENYRNTESLGASRSGFSLTDFPYLNTGSTELRDNSGNSNESGLHSFFGRLQYNYNNKYYLQGNIRSDQSSRFAAQFRTAVYPSISGGWAISEEDFMKDIKWLSFLKIRGGWGQAGNERLLDRNNNPAYYPYQATLDFTNALFYQNGVVVPLSGAGQQVYAVENITWETSQTTDFGLDAAFLNNRLSLSASYYKKKTFDILLPLDIPLYIGYDKPNQNAGTLNVKGFELELNWKDKIGEINYSIGANLSDAKSKIGDLKGTQFLGDQIIRTGSEYNEWFGYKYSGIFQNAAEVAAGPVANTNTKPGDFRYVDTNNDGRITPDDRVLLGGALPRYQYGGNIRADYKGFDFSLVFQGIGKKLSRLNSEAIRPFAEAFGNVPQDIVGKFWSLSNTPDQNLAAFYPRLSNTSGSNNYALSDHYLISGSYFRLKNITLGYSLKEEWTKKIGIKGLRIYISGNDLFSASKFPKYLDPEGGDYAYPIVSTVLAGARINF